jgi:hypothetical protein
MLRALKSIAGLLAGIALWWKATPLYNRLICAVAEQLIHVDRRFAGALLVAVERTVRVTSATTDLPMAYIPADLLTYNIILLFVLFAANERALGLANLRAGAISLAVLFVTHVAGLLISVESTFALRMGTWSSTYYSDFGQDVWLVLELFYRIVGMFGVAFACWWTARNRTT